MNSILKKQPVIWLFSILIAGVMAGFGADKANFYQKFGVDPSHLPYQRDANPRKELADAQHRAESLGKIVMVTFGANWCPDCLVLHRNLEEGETQKYANQHFEFVNVDVGEFNRNEDLAEELGVELKGIPVAIFFQSNGKLFANTNGGELEPSRAYTSKQILLFLRKIVEQGKVIFPNDTTAN